MAKHTAMPAVAAETATAQILSARVRSAVDKVRGNFTAFVRDFAALSVNRAELAPSFMRAFGLYQAETGGTFVDFVRLLDSTVGTTRVEYRAHKAYQAADYLRRLVATQSRAVRLTDEQRAEQRATAPVPPVEGMARLMRAFLPLVPEDQKQKLWDSLHVCLHWSDRQVSRVRDLVEDVSPLIVVRSPRGSIMPSLRLSVPQDENEQLAATA